MVTVSYKIAGSFTSNGVAYDLPLPIQTIQNNPILSGGTVNSQIASTTTQPSLIKFQTWNYTEWATGSKIIKSTWFKGFAAGTALQEGNNATPTMVATVESTNGFTLVNNTPLYGVEIVSASKANPGVFTFRGPGWTQNEQFNPGISDFATNDQIIFSGMGGSSGTDWSALNGNIYFITRMTSNTFEISTSKGGTLIDTSAYTGTYTASSGVARRIVDAGGNKIPPINMANVSMRLGTAVVGAASDVIYWEAELSDDYEVLGQL